MSNKAIVEAVTGDWRDVIIQSVIEEYKAIHMYDRVLKGEPGAFVRQVVEEIRRDEWNHVGRLCDLLKGYLSEDEFIAFKKGLEQTE